MGLLDFNSSRLLRFGPRAMGLDDGGYSGDGVGLLDVRQASPADDGAAGGQDQHNGMGVQSDAYVAGREGRDSLG